jgi:ABC-type multidrug transport system ATPase subunit
MSKLIADSIMLNYGLKKVLQDVYIELDTGKIVGILGRNGAGKSSLLKIIFGTLQGQDQSIRVNDERNVKPYAREGLMSFLPQDDFVPSKLKVKTVFKMFNINKDVLFTDFPVFSKLMDTRVRDLSGGERRLLETYLVLKKDVKFVLLDEPFSYLMPLHVEKLKELIKVEKANKCIVITDHMYKAVEELSDILYLVNNGKAYKVDRREQLVELGYLNRV